MTKSRYKDRVAVITGAADGIGKAIAERLVAEGASIALWDFNQDKLLALEKEWQDSGLPVKAFVVDISKESAVQDAYQATISHFGKLDILVNSAGIVGPTQIKITDYATEEFDKIYNVNLRALF